MNQEVSRFVDILHSEESSKCIRPTLSSDRELASELRAEAGKRGLRLVIPRPQTKPQSTPDPKPWIPGSKLVDNWRQDLSNFWISPSLTPQPTEQHSYLNLDLLYRSAIEWDKLSSQDAFSDKDAVRCRFSKVACYLYTNDYFAEGDDLLRITMNISKQVAREVCKIHSSYNLQAVTKKWHQFASQGCRYNQLSSTFGKGCPVVLPQNFDYHVTKNRKPYKFTALLQILAQSPDLLNTAKEHDEIGTEIRGSGAFTFWKWIQCRPASQSAMEKRGIKERSTSPTNKRRRISLSERTASSPEFSASQPTNYGAHVHLPKTSSLSAWDSTCERAADAGLLTIHSSNDSMRVDSQQLQSNSLLMTSLLQPDCQLGAHPPASHPEGSHLQADYSNQGGSLSANPSQGEEYALKPTEADRSQVTLRHLPMSNYTPGTFATDLQAGYPGSLDGSMPSYGINHQSLFYDVGDVLQFSFMDSRLASNNARSSVNLSGPVPLCELNDEAPYILIEDVIPMAPLKSTPTYSYYR